MADNRFLYFIQVGIGGPIKIGIASDVERRLLEVQIGCPYKLYLVLAVASGAPFEGLIHKAFKDINIRGEWFEPQPELMKFIEDARRRAIDAFFARLAESNPSRRDLAYMEMRRA